MSNSNQNEDRKDQNASAAPEASNPLRPHDCRYLVQVRRAGHLSWECRKENALLLSTATYVAGVPVPEDVRIELWECEIEDFEIDTWDRVRLLKRDNKEITPEDERAFERIRVRVDRCLTCRCKVPPNVDDGPNFDRTIGDLIIDARAKKDAEAKPAPVVPQPAPAPVPPNLTPKAEQKRKPKSRKPVRNDGWGRD
ncbi:MULTISPECIES: hypothetical protein [unclassified Bradyrhizobium]|uniref:hypothetical protein n=1 Tax=unclassified Bradyrhizobium TaxID=2631580 RepID=UPI001FF77590|nr:MULTISPECIES: hypothetical protein [unclassified Bradyrhizobium]MCK1730069.1 hypothetical protein [Bradyrhizobium sp. 142]MCK1778816.1 hypothetical protein [Bradyrhizobium sp. 132]MCK1287122.1 hypothetical protein [Bradyrhizobium sp. 44]MCK1514478.1 hypothetical protein [Bradyrhizobium sp. 190]MCK1529016.1 hypothetical protein [Bradyrhizobium sp. 182]